MKATRRTFLGGLAAASVPAAALATATAETQTEKCIRLARELLDELSQLPPNGKPTSFGTVLNIDIGGGEGSAYRYARASNGEEMLILMTKVEAGR